MSTTPEEAKKRLLEVNEGLEKVNLRQKDLLDHASSKLIRIMTLADRNTQGPVVDDDWAQVKRILSEDRNGKPTQ